MANCKKIISAIICVFIAVFMISCGSNSDDYTYDVVFKNWDGTILYQTRVEWGEDAVYRGPTPTKEGDEEKTYEFTGFSNTICITKNTTCVANYKTILNTNSENYTNVQCEYEKYKNGYKITKFYHVVYTSDVNLDVNRIVLPTMHNGLPVIAVGDKAFYEELRGYYSIVFPKYLEEIGDRAFYGASFSSIVTPSTLKSIGTYAFGGIGQINRITLNEGLETIGDCAFYGMRRKNIDYDENTLIIPKSVKYVGDSAFYTENINNSVLNIICMASSEQTGWHKEWNLCSGLGGKYESIYHNVSWGV